ncbi:AAA family ATPase [Paenibacillus ginsengihumi]|uniref:AAA family ATPase n=1 Tax=Paenibacillus ginsengihumi TaxID=431596 RepID=UPI0003657801|nr:AAA family ATPase [Paenibacillus ginsengihumi]
MNRLFLIGGTMGVGKTATCQVMKKKLNNSVFLDGDWCWDMHPFQVTEETKEMVLQNICCLLNNFIKCSVIENIVFCWVMHQQEIIDQILSRLDTQGCKVHLISLICSPDALRERLAKDIHAGIRTEDVLKRSLERIPLYEKLNTTKVDVSNITAEEAAEYIIRQFPDSN